MRDLLLSRSLFLPLAVAACDGPGVPGPLPNVMTAVVRMEEGGYASLAVDLRRPGTAPVVRATPGVLALGPGWARSALVTNPEQREGFHLALADLSPDGVTHDRSFATEPVFAGILETGFWLRAGSGATWEPLVDGAAAPDLVRPGGNRHRAGPGNGFHVRTRDNRLEMLLPKSPPDDWLPLMQGVAGIIGSWWLTTRDLPDWENALLDKRFHEVDAISAVWERARVDGRLGEWRDAHATPIDTRNHVLGGLEDWSGPRDASFGVAARRDDVRVFLAIRVRDDVLVPGEDRIELTCDERSVTIPVSGSGEVIVGDGWRAAFTEPMDYGIALEFETRAPGLARDQLVLPLVVHYLDSDPGEGGTRLGTAAEPWIVRAGYVD